MLQGGQSSGRLACSRVSRTLFCARSGNESLCLLSVLVALVFWGGSFTGYGSQCLWGGRVVTVPFGIVLAKWFRAHKEPGLQQVSIDKHVSVASRTCILQSVLLQNEGGDMPGEKGMRWGTTGVGKES
jgi:hypothetical protein